MATQLQLQNTVVARALVKFIYNVSRNNELLQIVSRLAKRFVRAHMQLRACYARARVRGRSLTALERFAPVRA